MRILLTILICLNIVSCKQFSTIEDKDNLLPYSSNKQFILDEDVIYQRNSGLSQFLFGARKGIYKAKYQDKKGYYYEGEGFSACVGEKRNPKGCFVNSIGGIWVSKIDPNDIRLYYIDGATEEEYSAPPIYTLLIGKYIIQVPSEEFANAIKTKKK